MSPAPTTSAAARLALEGGAPVRSTLLSYGRQQIDASDEQAVLAALRSDWLTTGPRVGEFERRCAQRIGCAHALAVSSGTAALHAIYACLPLEPGDEVIVPALTFAATANAALYCGAKVVFADVDAHTLLVDPREVARKLSSRTRAITGVDYAGQPADYAALRALARAHGAYLVADGCHALGASQDGVPVGQLADATAFSFHPVKHVTTGEGGLVATDDTEFAKRVRRFRNHGIETELSERERAGTWYYEMRELGYNYRLTDIQAALGSSQLARLDGFLARRAAIAQRYSRAFAQLRGLAPLALREGARHAWHLYVVQLELEQLSETRATIFRALRAEGIGVQVHYVPVHLHPYYRRQHGTRPGDCPVAEQAYGRLLSLPLFPSMSDADVEDVIAACTKVMERYRR